MTYIHRIAELELVRLGRHLCVYDARDTVYQHLPEFRHPHDQIREFNSEVNITTVVCLEVNRGKGQ